MSGSADNSNGLIAVLGRAALAITGLVYRNANTACDISGLGNAELLSVQSSRQCRVCETMIHVTLHIIRYIPFDSL